jgi:hypothetical protein
MAKNKSVAKSNGAANLYGQRDLIYSAENLARFDEQVKKGKPDECWPWQGRKTGPSGAFFVNGKELRVGKYVYLRDHLEADPNGRYVQECTPDCCNPAHVHPAGEVKKAGKKATTVPASKGRAKSNAKGSTSSKPAKAKGNAEPQDKATGEKGASKKGGKIDTTGLAFPKPSVTKKAKVTQPAPTAEKRLRAKKARK